MLKILIRIIKIQARFKFMPSFYYITDVFCPWCYAFSPVVSKIKQEYGLPFTVTCGALFEVPTNFRSRLEANPNFQAFFERLYKVTGVQLSKDYEKLLTSENNDKLFFDSQKGALLFYAMRNFLPGSDFEIIKEIQKTVYEKGLDIFDLKNQELLAKTFKIDFPTLQEFMQNEQNQNKSLAETEDGLDLMGDIISYPTLYYVDNENNKHFVSRAYVSYAECKAKLDRVIAQINNFPNKLPEINIPEAENSCSLDGKCE